MKQNRWTIKYRSLTYTYLTRSVYVSHWSLIPTMMFIHQIILTILNKITRPWNIGHVDIYLKSKFGSHCLIIWKYDTHASNNLEDIRQNHWTMKYKSHRPIFIFRSNVGSYWPIIPNYDVHISNSVHDIRQNHRAFTSWPTSQCHKAEPCLTSCLRKCFHNKKKNKTEKHFLKMF